MERDLVMPSWVWEAPPYGGTMESWPSRSRSSSGCQSGWTLYLDHSNGNGMRHLPCDDPPPRGGWCFRRTTTWRTPWPPTRPPGPARSTKRRTRGETFEQRLQGYGIGQHNNSCGVHYCSASSGSGGFGSSTWSNSRSSQGGVKGHVGRRGAVVHGGEATTCQYREIVVNEEDELDDTASSSAVFCNPMAMVHVNFSSCRKHQRSSHELRNI